MDFSQVSRVTRYFSQDGIIFRSCQGHGVQKKAPRFKDFKGKRMECFQTSSDMNLFDDDVE